MSDSSTGRQGFEESIRREAFTQTYEIREQLGSGSGGTVYKAWHKNLRKEVVLKRMHDSSKRVLDKRTETDALKNLRHPYIPQVYDFIEIGDDIYTVMDYIPGSTFKQLIEGGQKFTQKEVLHYAEQLYEVLAYLHSRNPQIIHGDIKPENLMLTPENNICLIDFNISDLSGAEGESGVHGYSPHYSSPEQLRWFQMNSEIKTKGAYDGETVLLNNGKSIDARSDIYSAAATLFYILTGQRPSDSGNSFKEPIELRPEIGEGLNHIIVRAMQIDPAERFQTAEEVLNALRNVNKTDVRYRRLVRRQYAYYAVAACMILLGVYLIFAGRSQIAREENTRYDDLLTELESLNIDYYAKGEAGVDDKSEAEFEKAYDACIAIAPKRVDPYVEKARRIYLKGLYEDAISFAEANVFGNSGMRSQQRCAEVWDIVGNCYFRMSTPDYRQAADAFQQAIELDGRQASYYQSLSIAQAKCGDLDLAARTLETAKEHGLQDASIAMAEGEIELASGDYTAAEQSFRECIQLSDDSEGGEGLLLRAYVGCHNAIISSEKTEETLTKAETTMKAALTALPQTQHLQILQYLAQDNIDLFSMTRSNVYAESAIEYLDRIEKSGWGDYMTDVNKAFLYEQLRDFDNAKRVLTELLKEDDQNYFTYKRLAYLSADMEGTKEASERNYEEFAALYERAEQLYSKNVNADDIEMQQLKQMKQELISGGWLQE